MLRSGMARSVTAIVCALVALAGAGLVLAAPFGTAFTYQGQLRQAGVPVNGTCDLQFTLFDAATGGAQVGAMLAATGVALVDGRFTVQLDFGGAAFDGNGRWLQIATRCPAGSGSFTPLDPRQPLSPSPYAIFATSATSFTGNLAGDVTGTQAATVVSRLQGRNVVNTAPADGAVLRYNSALSQWEPVVPVDVNTIHYAFVYSSTTQAIANAGFGNVVLEQTGALNGWTINSPGKDILTAPASGLYLIQYRALVTPPGAAYVLRVTRAGTEIPGSAASMVFFFAGDILPISHQFLAQVTAGDTVSLQGLATPARGNLFSLNVATIGADTPISASLTITRVN